MTALVHFDARGRWGRTLTGRAEIGAALHDLGLGFGRWPCRDPGDGSLDGVLAAYGPELDALKTQFSIRSVDRVSVKPDHPDWSALRRLFLTEHTHADAEVRFFLGGSGLFYVRVADGHLALLCEAGDWIVVPAGVRHFFDAGARPEFDALRLFSIPQGWAAEFTGAPTPALPCFDEFRARLAEALTVDRQND